MKKEFIVAKIEASTDGSPYIYVSFKDPSEYLKSGDKQMNPFGSNVMAFTSPEDLMKNLPKAMSNITNMFGGGAASDAPTFKVSMKEYDELKIKVGDKVVIDIQRYEHNDT
ncbi:hypothetical protein [Candidatus Nitrosocosmicus hydrocola]|jgi:hypothetical protein|uniref:hypothetical protein n=1 Tax=Candidatus Nitrosocosmicus hydrocola TaxID=1826872 RepID=UPI0011E59039|nr:hypothetical protein [Candidatus Nitrosocosmicus hydrocola]